MSHESKEQLSPGPAAHQGVGLLPLLGFLETMAWHKGSAPAPCPYTAGSSLPALPIQSHANHSEENLLLMRFFWLHC